jgi:peptidoglycan/xylan/chitin deacetylase (PgdA/CDA1 family)
VTVHAQGIPIRLVKLAVSGVVFSLDGLIRFAERFSRRPARGSCIVLYYHVVRGEERDRFGRQMDMVRKWGRPVSLHARPRPGDGERLLAVTFDDGFSCLIRNVLPELMKRNIPVAVFVPAGCMGQSPGWAKDAASPEFRERVMAPTELKELSRNGLVTIGSHGMSHANLLTLDGGRAAEEIAASKRELENLLGMEIKAISFPYGAYDPRHVEIAYEAGYEQVYSISPGFAFRAREERVTGRVRADPWDWPLEFRLKISGAYRWLPAAYSLKRIFRRFPGVG